MPAGLLVTYCPRTKSGTAADVCSFQLTDCQQLILLDGYNLHGHRVGPTLTHATGFSSLETPSCATARHAVGDAMSHFMRYDIVLEGTIAFRLENGILRQKMPGPGQIATHRRKCPQEHSFIHKSVFYSFNIDMYVLILPDCPLK